MSDKNEAYEFYDLCEHGAPASEIGNKRRCDNCQKEVDEKFDSFWRPLIYPNGELDVKEMKGNLLDFSNLMDNAKTVYMHITCGNIGNLLTDADAVIGEADRQRQKLIDEAVKEAEEEFIETHICREILGNNIVLTPRIGI
jgi:hypothetical protein